MSISQLLEKYQNTILTAKEKFSQYKMFAVDWFKGHSADVKLALLLIGGGAVAIIIALTQWPHTHTQPEVLGISTASASPSAQVNTLPVVNIKVDVSGAVNHPGVVVLKDGDRVDDALRAAGGYSDRADIQYLSAALNLAQKLTDGDKLYIPDKDTKAIAAIQTISPSVYQPASKSSAVLVQPSISSSQPTKTTPATATPTKTPTITPSGPISINNASQSDLESLPGIGPSYAQKIISHRPYTSVDQVCVTGILGTGSLCQKITPLITL